MTEIMKIITVGLLLLLCALVTAEQEKLSDKSTKNNNEETKEENDDDHKVQEDTSESGSSAELENNEGSGEFGSAESGDVEDEIQTQMPAPKPMKFRYFGMRGPVKITPMEPMVNRQKPFRRRCFFCFPRGRLGRVEVTPPGGPYLMNGFGPMDGFGMGPYPGMGFPEPGPGFPAMGGFGDGGPCCGGPCCGGPCCGGPCGGGSSNQGPMIFEGINEEEEPSKASSKVRDKPMQQSPIKGEALTPNKVMDQAPNKAAAPSPNKAAAPSPNKVMDQPPNQAPNKVASNEPMKNLQTAEKLSDKPSKTKPQDEE